MNADDGLGEIGVFSARFANRAKAVHEGFEGAGDEGRTKLRDAVAPASLDDVSNLFARERLGVEADAVTAVYLDVTKRGGDPGCCGVIGGSRIDARDLAVLANEIKHLAGAVVACAETH